MPGKYSEHDWAELPAEAKKAAEALGYNQEMWDDDDDPEDIWDSDWEELTAEQQAHAKVLGYDEDSWDEDE
jgi:hypothetical protein